MSRLVSIVTPRTTDRRLAAPAFDVAKRLVDMFKPEGQPRARGPMDKAFTIASPAKHGDAASIVS